MFILDDILIGAAIASTVASAASVGYSYYNSQQQAKQAEYNAQYQADLERQKAEEEMIRGAQEVQAQRKVNRNALAAMEAKYAKAGVTMLGSPTKVMEEQAITDEYNLRNRMRLSTSLASRYLDKADMGLDMGNQVSSAYKAQGIGNLVAGIGSTINTGLSLYGSAHELKTPPDADTTSSFVGPKPPKVRPQF